VGLPAHILRTHCRMPGMPSCRSAFNSRDRNKYHHTTQYHVYLSVRPLF
jgi:hypothetical protein